MRDSVTTDRRDEAAAAILGCLIANDPDNWLEVQQILRRCLSEQELGAIAWAALRAMPGETAFDVAKNALECGWEYLPPLDPEDKKEALANANLWAAGASQTELKAAAMVAVQQMAPRSRRGFSDWLKKEGPA